MKNLFVLIATCCALPVSLLAQSTASARVSDLVGTSPFKETINFTQQAVAGGAYGMTFSGPVTAAQLTDTGTFSFDGRGGMSIEDSGSSITTVFPPPPPDAGLAGSSRNYKLYR